jgi:hypothetical protein
MKKIFGIILTLSMLIACNQSSDSERPKPIKHGEIITDDIRITNLIKSRHTPTGISIITLPDGKRFLYCENGNNVSCIQINEGDNYDMNNPFTPLDTVIKY